MVEEIIQQPEIMEFLRKGIQGSPDVDEQRFKHIDEFGRESGKTMSPTDMLDMVENQKPGWQRIYRAAERLYSNTHSQESQ